MRSQLLALVMFFLFAGSALVAADKTWTGGGGAGVPDWASGTNWGGVAPVANDSLIFPILTPSSLNKTASNSYAAGTAFGPITIDAGGYVLSGNQIDLNGGFFLNGANTAQVVLPLELAVPLAFTVSHGSGILTLTQPISGAGGIIKSGNGLLILNGSHTYSGPTIIHAGGLQVGGSVPGVIQVTTGTIIGTGSVDGITSLNQGVAAIAPGTSSAIGTLTSDGDVTLFANDRVYFDITSTGSDKLTVNGEVDLGIGTDGINLALQSGYVPAVNTSFVLIENDGTDPVVFDAVTPSNYLIPTFTMNGQRFQVSFVGGTNRNDVVLKKVGPSNATVTLTTSDALVAYGDSVTFTASVTGGAVDGFPVSFWDGNEFLGSSNIVGFQAQFTTTTLKPSTLASDRMITAMFEGNTSLAPARSAILSQAVTGTLTSTGLVVSPAGSSASGALVTLTATVTGGSPTGTVTFFDGGVEMATIAVTTNQAVHTTSTLIAGAHSLSATFNPTGGFVTSSSSAVAHTVDTGTTDTSTVLTTSAASVVAGTDVTFTATVSNATSGSVVFRDGVVTLATVAVSGGGVATLTTSGLAAGSHSITADYLGTTVFEPSDSNMVTQVITAAPDGSGSTTDPNVELSSGCGLGSGVSALLLGLLMMLGLRLRRS